jgi:hypothetical protein
MAITLKVGDRVRGKGSHDGKTMKIEKCPFCGGEAALREWDGFGQYVRCTRCRAGGPVKPKPLLTEAISAWNRRTQPDMGNPITDNIPLTLDELLGMDRQPVYIICGDKNADLNGWFVVSVEPFTNGYTSITLWGIDAELIPDQDFYGMCCSGKGSWCKSDCQHGLHQLGWLAYRTKPKEDA